MIATSKSRTPVDTGALRASGVVLPPKVDGDGIVVELGHGGAAADYAVPVHERLDVRHPVGQAKFLESAVEDGAAELARDVAAALAAEFGRLRP